MQPPFDSCTAILVGKNTTYDGSTMMARTEDSGADFFGEKRHVIIKPEDQPRHYKSKLSKFELDLPDNPLQYTSMLGQINLDYGLKQELILKMLQCPRLRLLHLML